MSQKQVKQKKCRITHQELYNRFYEADIDGNGSLSADQITILLQNLGYQDTYKGTIRKICRYLNKQKKLKGLSGDKNQQNSVELNDQKSQNDSNADLQHKETQQQKRIRKQQQKKKEEQEAEIGFEEFQKYFDILEKPIGKTLYKLSLQRSVQVATLCKEVNIKNMFHKDKGQKLKVNLLVGEPKPSYNSFIDFKVEKEPKSKKNEDIYFIELQIDSSTPQNATKIIGYIKELIQMLMGIIISENQQFGQIKDILLIEGNVEGNVAKIKISTKDEDVKRFINQFSNTFDEILDTELVFVIKALYQFNFLLQDIKNNPNSMVEDILVKDANLKIQYSGSRFLDAVKELALSKNVFELLRVDTDPLVLSLLGFLSMEKGNVFFKFKNIERTEFSRSLTQEMLQMLTAAHQIQSEEFSLKSLSQLVTGQIKLRIQLESIKLDLNINVKDLLKLPFMMYGGQGSGSDSD